MRSVRTTKSKNDIGARCKCTHSSHNERETSNRDLTGFHFVELKKNAAEHVNEGKLTWSALLCVDSVAAM